MQFKNDINKIILAVQTFVFIQSIHNISSSLNEEPKSRMRKHCWNNNVAAIAGRGKVSI